VAAVRAATANRASRPSQSTGQLSHPWQGQLREQGLQALDRGHAAHGGSERPDEGDANLDRRQEAVRIGLETQQSLRSPVTCLGSGLDAPQPGRDHGDLCSREEPVQQDEESDEDKLEGEAVTAHRRLLPRCRMDPLFPGGRGPPLREQRG
jgi:hypothetical protein